MAPRTHIGAAVTQIHDASGMLRNSIAGLRSRLTGEVPSPVPDLNTGPAMVAREANVEPCIADMLGFTLDLLNSAHHMLEQIHKEVSRG